LRALIDPEHTHLSIRRQCELLQLNRSTYYQPPAEENDFNFELMREIDVIYTRWPFYGSRRITVELKHMNYAVNRKRIQRLMRLMGIQAIYPRPKTSTPNKKHRIYPYLLRGVPISSVNQVWSTDITYIPLPSGWAYLVAVMDWFSRYVLSWTLSNSMETGFCLDALDDALLAGRPDVFNTDQGSQFTSDNFTGRVLAAGSLMSMDGRGRCLDNVWIERLWRSVKYDDIYLHDYQSLPAVRRGLAAYFDFYNHRRRHQSLDYRTPAEVYGLGNATAGCGQ
jgi:putative transposase